MATSTAEGGEVALSEVLSTCVDAALRGCAEIRRVQAERGGGALAVELKDPADARSALTEADLAAQRAVVGALRAAWPGLAIVGEEDGHAAAAADAAATGALRRDLCAELACAARAPLRELAVFVDPLDGTREFVEGRLENVQCLVGVTRRGRPVAGAVGLPFLAGADAPASCVFALVGAGAGTLGARPPPQHPLPPSAVGEGRPVVVTGDSSNAVLAAARQAALGDTGRAVLVGACGSKVLRVVDGAADLAIMHFGTSFWDTAAPAALLAASGGKVTDLFGAPLVHTAKAPSFQNALGVVASAAGAAAAHDALCRAMRACPEALALLLPFAGRVEGAPAQAADVARTLDGAPLQAESLGALLGATGATSVAAYSAPESSAFCGMMSDGCRLELQWATAGDAALPSSVFYKRVSMGDLEHARQKALASPAKLARDVRSYAVEAGFLGSAACSQLGARGGVHVTRALHSELRPCDEEPIESKFAMLLQDFSPADGWRQSGMLAPAEARGALSTLARLHAFFWPGARFWEDEAAGRELEAAVWPAGGYWQPSMQPAEQWDSLAERFAAHRAQKSFGEAFAQAEALRGIDLEALGRRLQAVAREAAAEAHPFDAASGGDAARAAPFRTLMHGDPKAANLFLRGAAEVAMIDFQWCGFGLGATDVAHHVCAALAPECVSADGALERGLLDHYHGALCEALVEFGAAPSAAAAASDLLPRDTLQAQFDAAMLDMARLVFSYQWSRANFSSAPLNRNSYNKSWQCALWLVRRCDALLTEREAWTRS